MMNNIVILCDPHFGARGDSIDFHNYFKKFYDDIFFPYLIENNIKLVIIAGDSFERRKFVNINSFYLAREYFFDRFNELGIELIAVVGNHDAYFKNTLSVNSLQNLLGDKDDIKIIKDFETININDTPIDFVPWICDDNVEDIASKIKASKSQICIGHFELSGFEMDKGNVFKGGTFNIKDLKKYDMVFTGHFHHKSDDGHIFYLGTPYQITFSDYNDLRGFHTFNTDTRELEFIENPYQMFHKITYDDSIQDSEYWKEQDLTVFKDTYVKITVIHKSDAFLFDCVMDRLEKVGVCDIGVVEDFTIKEIEEEESLVDQSQDTLSILNKWIDNQEFSIDSDKLKNVMREIYIEAINVGKTE